MLNPGIVYVLAGAQVTYVVELIGQTTTSGKDTDNTHHMVYGVFGVCLQSQT
jgi:hypothetical protein